MIFRFGDQVVYPDYRYPDGRRGWVCKPPPDHPVRQPDGSFKSFAPPYYEGGAFVLGKDHNSPMWFDGQHLRIGFAQQNNNYLSSCYSISCA